MSEFIAVHLLAARDKLEQEPTFVGDLNKSVLVQGGEQQSQFAPGFHVGVLIYLRQDGHLIPERLDPVVYLSCVEAAVEAIMAQCIKVASTPEG